MGYNQPNTTPAIMQPTQEPPAYTKSGQQIHEPQPALNTEDLQVILRFTQVQRHFVRILGVCMICWIFSSKNNDNFGQM